MTGRLGGKVIVVSGGSSGIGRAVAQRVAAEDGAVVIGARRAQAGQQAAAEIKAAGGRAVFVAADMTVEAQARELVDAALTEFGRLDGAFNNAGDVATGGPLAQIDAAAWQEALATNLTSVFYSMKAQIPALATGGSIVNNASIGGVAGIGGMAPYVAAKHGVVGLTRSAALECADRGLRINALVTGNVDTPLYRRLIGVGPEVGIDELPAPNPAGRVASPAEVAAFVAFLLSDESAFITGAALAIDGGFTAG
ncbi:MAG TPA: SDR family oxidoreductase [Streptosporangiaceae bacterium]|nr:SDR family oxidoreductase [Streptosporangiaceae bacterium]